MRQFHVYFVSILTLFIGACDRHDYTTWKCVSKSATAHPFSFILDGSNLKMNEQLFSFCGSLGPNSFFDTTCPAESTNGSLRFNLKTGQLSLHGDVYECERL